MSTSKPLIVVGASARAAAFSAIRSGFTPFWIDLFGDLDLAEVAEGLVVSADGYPTDLIARAEQAPPGPWMYTGAIENHLDVVTAISKRRPLLGNDAETCAAVRNPMRLSNCFAKAGIHFPEISRSTQGITQSPAWIIKPLRSGGGIGISRYRDASPFDPDQHYLQQFIDGRPVAGIFVGDGRRAGLLGVTQQLIGQPWLCAKSFAYCGSIGPMRLAPLEEAAWQRIGTALAETFNLQGLFGVDAIQHAETIWPVEVNPRYTASVEVLENATGISAIALHRDACVGTLPDLETHRTPLATVGKAILFAPTKLLVPDDLFAPGPGQEKDAVSFADVPHPGSAILPRHPITTVLVRGEDEATCAARLRTVTQHLYTRLAQMTLL